MKAGVILLMGLLFLFYFTLFCPVALIYRCLADPLRLSRKLSLAGGGFFLARKRVTETRETASQPF